VGRLFPDRPGHRAAPGIYPGYRQQTPLMSAAEFALIADTLGIIIFYAITGLAPGMMVGFLLGNQIAARGQETMMNKQETEMKKADEHNAQWNPSHRRWRQ